MSYCGKSDAKGEAVGSLIFRCQEKGRMNNKLTID
jgi:hypothetical protein